MVVSNGFDKSLTILIKQLHDIQSAVFSPNTAEVAPALHEVVICSVGQVIERGRRCQESVRAAAESSDSRFSVLQHCLVALEHTLGNFWSSALQRDLRERRVTQGSVWLALLTTPLKCKIKKRHHVYKCPLWDKKYKLPEETRSHKLLTPK